MALSTSVRKPVREGLYQAVGALVDQTAKAYAESTGRPLDGKVAVFVKEVIMSMIGLLDEAIASGGKPDLKSIAKFAVSRAVAVAGLPADEKSMAECIVALIALAVATVDVFGILVGAAGISTTGTGAVIGVPVMLSAAAFYAFQVSDAAQTCGDAAIARLEKEFAAQYNAPGRRQMMTNYGEQVCKAP